MKITLKAVGNFLAQPSKVQVVTVGTETRGVHSAILRVKHRAGLGVATRNLETFGPDFGLGQIEPSDQDSCRNHETAPLTWDESLPEIQVID
jgi:hypothetical protein